MVESLGQLGGSGPTWAVIEGLPAFAGGFGETGRRGKEMKLDRGSVIGIQ